MAAKSKSKHEEALQFLDDLDSMAPAPSPSAQGPKPGAPNDAEAAEALAFLDEITQKSSAKPAQLSAAIIDRPSSRAGTPTVRKSTERVRVGTPVSQQSTVTPSSSTSTPNTKAEDQASSWGWGSVWSSASAAIQQAKTVVEEQAKNLPKNEQALKWTEGMMEYAKNAQLDKIGG